MQGAVEPTIRSMSSETEFRIEVDRSRKAQQTMPLPLRVGAVSYLNAKPLYHRFADFAPGVSLEMDVPSRLAGRLAAGSLDVALIPSVEYLRGLPAGYRIIPGFAIAARGAVRSVKLFSRVPLGRIQRLALDEGSRTSQALVRVFLAEVHGVRPRSVESLPLGVPVQESTADAILLIGDRAMRACLPGYRFAYDLGEEWTAWTGLPMVFAVWAVRNGVELGEAEAAFHRAKEHGLANAGAIAQREAPALGLDAGFCRRYMSNVIRYDLGPAELAGMRKFRELAEEMESRRQKTLAAR